MAKFALIKKDVVENIILAEKKDVEILFPEYEHVEIDEKNFPSISTGDIRVGETFSRPQKKDDYKALRREAYGLIGDELDMMYWDAVEGTTRWIEHCAGVKEKYQKN